jgi:HSP20 family molecular chaperone IbpA
MFTKKDCTNCNNKLSKKDNFCPSCGAKQTDQNDWGMLGKNDAQDQTPQDPFANLFSGGLMGNAFGKLLGNTIKILEKEMQKEMRNVEKTNHPRTNMRLMVNGKEIPINQMQKQKIQKKERKKIIPKKLEGFSKLPQKEPKTNLRRFADKIIYEVEIPGVKSLEDISISQLEKSVEIKAIAKNKAYFKIIQVSLPIIDYIFEKGKLVLEFEART